MEEVFQILPFLIQNGLSDVSDILISFMENIYLKLMKMWVLLILDFGNGVI